MTVRRWNRTVKWDEFEAMRIELHDELRKRELVPPSADGPLSSARESWMSEIDGIVRSLLAIGGIGVAEDVQDGGA